MKARSKSKQQKNGRCSCTTKTPAGREYHPALKTVYVREGAAGLFVKTGFQCPSCRKFYDLNK